MRTRLRFAVSLAALVAAPAAAQPNVIELTQLPCQFLESERGRDRGFRSAKAADCEAINKRTGAKRVAESKTIELKPGNYVYSCPLNPTPDYRLVVR